MDRGGFTLLEMLVVLAILGLTVTLFAPMVGKDREISADTSARILAAALEVARSRAIAGNVETVYVIDAARRAASGPDVTLNIAAAEMDGEGRGGIRFYPDGSSSGGRIAFDDGKAISIVSVDWLTGGVDVGRR